MTRVRGSAINAFTVIASLAFWAVVIELAMRYG